MIKILPFYLLLSLFTTFTLWGCSDDNEEEIAGDMITIGESYLSISADAETTTASIKFTARSGWTASVKETEAQDWLTLSATEGIGGTITLDLTLAINDNEATRTATIILTCCNTQKEITVTQSGSDLQIMDESEIEDFEKYYKPAEFASMDMLRSDAQWSWFRSKQSEHFFVFWEAGFGDDPNAETVPANMRVDIDDLLEKAELFYQTNIDKLGFAETGQG